MKRDIYQEVTDQIVAELERGAAPWVKPWETPRGFTDIPHNVVSNREYTGTNVLLLWLSCAAKGYGAPAFLTFKQAKKAGGHVRKGERGFRVIYTSKVEKEVEKANGETETRAIPFLKAYTVFNVEQCEGLPADWCQGAANDPRPALLADNACQEFVRNTGASIAHRGNKAFYSPSGDFVQMPHPLDFNEYAGYEAVLLHELGHWTGHKSRLDRAEGMKGRFGTSAYAAEELVAELTAAFLCAHLGIKGELRHAAYIETWLKLLRSDKRAIFTAASKAQKAADYLRAFSQSEELKDDA